jgi:A/G-specific adenine glycosylase
MDRRYFSKKIVEWYQNNRRNLPWRDTGDPYKIWLSEIILQQTRVLQGLPYYQQFVSTFPTIHSLAIASEQQVLRLWQGLGYYSRARNLHKCAKLVSKQLKGEFPRTYADLKNLPGVGDYTAAAISSFTFNEKVAVVDGNVFRVLSRIFGIDEPVNSTAGRKVFSTLANELIPAAESGTHNQAVMEFGATWCVPVNPRCEDCIFKKTCVAFLRSRQRELPVKLRKAPSRKRYFTYLVFRKGSSLMMKKRESKDIWYGLYDFPLVEKTKPVSVSRVLSDFNQPAGKFTVTDTYKHVLTHQTIYCKFIIIPWDEQQKALQESKFYSVTRISSLPKPVLISRFLNDLSFFS